MVDDQRSVGGHSLGTESPQQDVIDGWNFKVQGSVDGGEAAQALELSGLVPFVQLIGIYDGPEIDRLLGRKDTDSFGTARRAVFDKEDKSWEDYKNLEDTLEI